ncbi:nucleotidyltransferase [Halobacillus rhizosphaerae]|uniref:nucleotidyltransferase n=1 Tax=Halobacillus rhizosphaerae TaxID=3064889 RepID=UPI00398A75EE
MKACGVIVEYNPFHNGHRYHLEQSRQVSEADCMIAVMSGNFLQRGEPAIIDKWHRAEAALHSGADLVLELPCIYAVEHSDYFSKGAVNILAETGVDSICFGSEHGSIDDFIEANEIYNAKAPAYHDTVRQYLNRGYSFPEASRLGYKSIGLTEGKMDLSMPNNILGYSYVKQILNLSRLVQPLTIQRTSNQFHEETIRGSIASATSIRKELLLQSSLTDDISSAIPSITQDKLIQYKEKMKMWHSWEDYFQLLQYKILTLKEADLRAIHGVDEGLEYRIKRTIRRSVSFLDFMERLKTKRYTWTRLQRTLAHILIGTTKEEARVMLDEPIPPYVRLLGMNHTGQAYLNQIKKQMRIPLVTQPQHLDHPMLDLEEKASIAYYSILNAERRVEALQGEYHAPLVVQD